MAIWQHNFWGLLSSRVLLQGFIPIFRGICYIVALVYKFVYIIGDYLSRGHIDILVQDEVEDPILCVPSAN